MMSPESCGRSLLVDDPDIGQLIGAFVEKLPERLKALRDAEQRSAWLEVANLAHQMAGAAGGYGFPEMGKFAARIEVATKGIPNPRELAHAMAAFDTLCMAAIHGHAMH